MKIFKISKFVVLGSVLVLTASCKKYLETAPDNRTEINSIEKVSQLLATAYPTNDYVTFAESASDNAEDKGVGIGNLDERTDVPYAWADLIGSGSDNSSGYWNASYESIAAANQALESIEKENLGPAAIPYKGEALVARAYAHFMLSIFFAKPYEKGGANNSPGIPYITSSETKVLVNYSRGTVQSTYEKIQKDLEEGIKLLSVSAYKSPKFHFTPAAANAFASRFYLFTGDWQKAIDAATLTVPGNDFVNNMRRYTTDLKSITAEEFRTNFNSSAQKYNLLIANCYSTYFSFGSSPRHGYGPKLAKMFTQKNVTGKVLANRVLSYSSNDYTTYKYKGYFFNTGPGIGYNLCYTPLLTVDEALMNRAEAYVEANQFDKALKDINDFMSVRITGFNPSTDAVTLAKIKAFYLIDDPKEGLIKTILDSKKAEFLQEGIRWFDIVRRRLTVVHNIFTTTSETFVELGPNDPRRLFQLPLEVNLSGIELNPR